MPHSVEIPSLANFSRRDFLAVGGAGVVGLSLRDALAARPGKTGAVIQIVLNGGASHLETFDPKPHAPREIRGPLHSIQTRIPSVRFSECLPRLAERADQLVIVRSLFHDAAPIHRTGLQLLQAGSLVTRKKSPPQIGLVLEQSLKPRRRAAVSVELGRDIDAEEAQHLTRPEDLRDRGQPVPDFNDASPRARDAYGATRFGEQLWTAARLIERGSQYLLVNTFDQIEGQRTWDAHGDPQIGPATVFDYRDSLGPQFDLALAALIDDLQSSGLWQQTLIICAGEMGRTPKVNEEGGRDHWTRAWSGLLAGGMLSGGQVIGETDEHGEEVLSDPMPVSQLPFMALQFLGLNSETHAESLATTRLAPPLAEKA
ncbi:DUF1501 domain-containing protein [Planctomicrobium piriforme]|uniref:Tat (Twin-arginine translocation) pathway signal sequence n=1 Tax=Planctomicrobium piriforme TaxID=1576369 RepID=A0A1I3GYM5_9PLAN|nr:DUF1501 domain-containing protein [Planctomicrobium piriforme]SFI28625.1 Protein of unknown function [Planctomicrobium piriforme]